MPHCHIATFHLPLSTFTRVQFGYGAPLPQTGSWSLLFSFPLFNASASQGCLLLLLAVLFLGASCLAASTNIIYEGEKPEALAPAAPHDESCPLSTTFNANLLAPSSLRHLKRICILVFASVCLLAFWLHFEKCLHFTWRTFLRRPLILSFMLFRGSFLNEVNQIFMCR